MVYHWRLNVQLNLTRTKHYHCWYESVHDKHLMDLYLFVHRQEQFHFVLFHWLDLYPESVRENQFDHYTSLVHHKVLLSPF